MDKTNIDIVKKTALEKGLMLLDSEYKNQYTKMNFIDLNSYRYSMTYANLRSSTGSFMKFSKFNPYTVYNMKKWLSLNENTLTLLSDVYTNMNDKNIVIECICGHTYQVTLCNLVSARSGCPICNKQRDLKYNDEDIKNIINKNVEILNKYTGIKEKAQCKCKKCNHMWETIFDVLINSKTGCPSCANARKNGETSATWKGGITPLYGNIRGFMLPWKINSYEKYNHKCDITGIKLNSNVIHHHHNYSDILKETLKELGFDFKGEISNYTKEELELIKEKCLDLHYKYGLGICLSEEIHKEFHSLYGVKNNTLKQYIEFKENKLKEMDKRDER